MFTGTQGVCLWGVLYIMETYFQNYVTKVHLQNPFKFPSWVQCPNVTGISIQLSKLLIMPHEAGNTYQLKLHNLNLVFPKFPFIQYHVNYCGVPWGHSSCTLGTAS